MKYLPINGITFSQDFKLFWYDINGRLMEYTFLSKEGFEKEHGILMNYEETDMFDCVVMYKSQNHNSYEIQAVKSIISILTIVDRMICTNKRYDNYLNNNPHWPIELLEKDFIENESDFWANERLNDAYYNNDSCIVSNTWNIAFGNVVVDKNNFERYTVRYFDYACVEEYERQRPADLACKRIEIGQEHIEKYTDIIELIESKKENYMKIHAASYLYFEILNLQKNSNLSVITLSIMFETLLLKKSESNQRKKVSVRAACIVANGQSHQRKQFIANNIYHFYEYRNGIVHDGKNYLQVDEEYIFDLMLYRMKTIIYCIIKFIVDNQIETINKVKELVCKNMEADGLENAFDYITIENKDRICSSDYLVFTDER